MAEITAFLESPSSARWPVIARRGIGGTHARARCRAVQISSPAGIAVGMAAALGLTRLIQSMLYGIRPYDPITLLAGVGLLLAVALAATWIPARRGASVQPMDAFRHE